MTKAPIISATIACVLAVAGLDSRVPLLAQRLAYPQTKKVDHVDTYFGVKVADPYRWLEEENAPETAAWVEAQNRVTFEYLAKIPYRGALKSRLETLFNYAKYGAPSRNGEHYVFSKNEGLQNQSVLYIQKGLDGTPAVLLDPNTFASDGTRQLSGFVVTFDRPIYVPSFDASQVKRDQTHAAQVRRHATLMDCQRETLDNCGLTDARITD